MPGFLDRLRSPGTPAEPSLQQRLSSYPPFDAPWPGPGSVLSPEQAAANLEHLRGVKYSRIDALAALLKQEGAPDLHSLLDRSPPPSAAIADVLFQWAKARWPTLARAPAPGRAHWWATRRAGSDIAYSMFVDVAIVLGESIVRNNPAWRWDVDLSAESLARDLQSVRRVVLLADPVGTAREAFIIDLEAEVVALHIEADNPARTALNRWANIVRDAVDGAHQAWFLKP